MKRFFRKPTTWLVLALVIFFGFAVSKEARGETSMEVGPLVAYGGDVRQGQVAIMLTERWLDKYELGVILLVDDEEKLQGNRGFQILRVTSYKSIEVGIGFAYWAHTSDAWSENETFSLMLGKAFGSRFAVRLRHWSTGSTSTRNGGLDILTLSYTF